MLNVDLLTCDTVRMRVYIVFIGNCARSGHDGAKDVGSAVWAADP